MTQLPPLIFEDIWLRPTPNGMVFCEEKDGFAPINLEVDISAPKRDDWHISAVRMEIEDPVRDAQGSPVYTAKGVRKYRKRYEELTGALLEQAIVWLGDHRDFNLVHHVQMEYLPSMLGSYADYRHEAVP